MANAVDVNEADQRKKQARKALKAWKKNQKTNLFELKDENNKSTTIKLAGKVPLPRVCDPVISQLNPSVYLGAVSPQFDDEAAEYVEKYDKYAERNRPSCKDALRDSHDGQHETAYNDYSPCSQHKSSRCRKSGKYFVSSFFRRACRKYCGEGVSGC